MRARHHVPAQRQPGRPAGRGVSAAADVTSDVLIAGIVDQLCRRHPRYPRATIARRVARGVQEWTALPWPARGVVVQGLVSADLAYADALPSSPTSDLHQ